ncbi:MAG TPA: hypothetical protein PLI09_11120 [Candidatus Hydrogenedentes bacterium]|nr:hypothetical protein [Candidatus Hydrogenedentota bacterium]
MDMLNRNMMGWMILVLTGLAPMAFGADYPMHARVSFDAGGTMVKGSEDAAWSHATLNTLIMPGDMLWVDQGGTAELEFAGGTFLRMADGSKADIAAMPPNIIVRGWKGSFFMQRLNRSTGDAVFTTPAGRVEVERDTAVRLDVLESGATTVSVRWGRVTVRTDMGGAVNVSFGERCWIDPGMLPSMAVPFDRSSEDAFDLWNGERAKYLALGPEKSPVPVQVTNTTIGVSDLCDYGEWIQEESVYYWRPTVVVDYVPYRNGHWSVVMGVGSVWVEDYPFSYVTSHYGRWLYRPTYGWVWGYDPVWSPAWVATVHCGDYFMWAPVDFYYRPVYMHGSAMFTVGGVAFDLGFCSYVHADYMWGHYGHVYGPDPHFIDYVHHHNHDINIWNITVNNYHNPVRVPYDHPEHLVRDYHPPRAIRGPEAFGDKRGTASERVRSLEGSIGRDRFSAVDRTGSRNTRTERINKGSADGVRSVRLDKEATVDRPPIREERTSMDRSDRIDRSKPAEWKGRVSKGPESIERDQGGVRGARIDRSGDRESIPSTQDRSKQDRTESSRIERRTDTPDRGDTGRINRTPDRSTPRKDGDSQGRIGTPELRAPERTVERSTPQVERTQPIERNESPSIRERTPERTAPQIERSQPIQQNNSPSIRERSPERATPRVERSQPINRSESPKISAPTRSFQESGRTSFPDSGRSTVRMDRSPSVQTPRVAPESRSSQPNVRSFAPQPRVSSPAPESRSMRSAPSFSAPSREPKVMRSSPDITMSRPSRDFGGGHSTRGSVSSSGRSTRVQR